jgi:hypothetical protein
MRIRPAGYRPDPRGRIGGISTAGEWARQLGLRGAHDESEHSVKRRQPIAVP